MPRLDAPAAQAAWQAEIAAAIRALCDPPGLAQRFADNWNDAAPLRPPAGVPWSAGLPCDHVVAIAATRPWRVRSAGDGAVYIVAAGKPLAFDEAAAPLLDYLRENSPIALSAFYGTFQPTLETSEIDDLLAVLAAHGLVSFHAPGTL